MVTLHVVTFSSSCSRIPLYSLPVCSESRNYTETRTSCARRGVAFGEIDVRASDY